MAEPMTTDELARLIQQEFAAQSGNINQRFDVVDKRLEDYNRRFDAMDQKIDAVVEVLKGIQN